MSSKYDCYDPVISGGYMHDCNKSNCAYCEIMGNTSLTRKDGWKSWQLAYLESNYKEMSTARLSEILNRSASAIWQKIHEIKSVKKAA